MKCPKCNQDCSGRRFCDECGHQLDSSAATSHHSPHDRTLASKWARKLLEKTDWVILDTDDTSVERDGESFRIAVIDSTGLVLFNQLIHPSVHWDQYSESALASGLSRQKIESAPRYASVARELQRVVKDKLIVSYNAAYRKHVLKRTADRSGVPPLDARWKCAMYEYARFVGEWSERFENYKLQPLPGSQRRGVAKDSVGDCLAVLQLLRAMASDDGSLVQPGSLLVQSSARIRPELTTELVARVVSTPSNSVPSPVNSKQSRNDERLVSIVAVAFASFCLCFLYFVFTALLSKPIVQREQAVQVVGQKKPAPPTTSAPSSTKPVGKRGSKKHR